MMIGKQSVQQKCQQSMSLTLAVAEGGVTVRVMGMASKGEVVNAGRRKGLGDKGRRGAQDAE